MNGFVYISIETLPFSEEHCCRHEGARARAPTRLMTKIIESIRNRVRVCVCVPTIVKFPIQS